MAAAAAAARGRWAQQALARSLLSSPPAHLQLARRRAYSGAGGGAGGGWRHAAAGALGNPVNWLLGANAAVFLLFATVGQSDRRVYRWVNRHMVLSRSRVNAGYWDCLLLSTFMHLQPLHLAVNLMALHSFGNTAHTMLGARTFLALYVTSGLVGSAAQLYYPTAVRALRAPAARSVHWDTSAVGASGAIAGVTTYVCCRVPHGEVLLVVLPVKNWVFIPGFVGISAYLAWQGGESTVGHAAHLGGAAVGFALFLARRGRF